MDFEQKFLLLPPMGVVTYVEVAERKFTPKYINQKLAYKTGTLNTLYKILLSK